MTEDKEKKLSRDEMIKTFLKAMCGFETIDSYIILASSKEKGLMHQSKAGQIYDLFALLEIFKAKLTAEYTELEKEAQWKVNQAAEAELQTMVDRNEAALLDAKNKLKEST